MGILNVCKVITNIGELKKDGTSAAAVNVPYYFLGSSVYNDSTFATAVGIEMIPADKWDGSHPLVPIAQLIEANIIDRLSVVVKNGANKKQRYDLAVSSEKVGKLIDGTAAEKLDGKSYKLLTRTGTTVDKGQIVRVGSKTTQYNP